MASDPEVYTVVEITTGADDTQVETIIDGGWKRRGEWTPYGSYGHSAVGWLVAMLGIEPDAALSNLQDRVPDRYGNVVVRYENGE